MTTRKLNRAFGLTMLAVFLTVSLLPTACLAGTAGRRNTAIGLTAGAVYSAVRGKKTAAIGLGAGAAYAWKRHADARVRVAQRRSYRHGYHKGYRRGYHRGYIYGRHNKHRS